LGVSRSTEQCPPPPPLRPSPPVPAQRIMI
jgi:hypothetical protein